MRLALIAAGLTFVLGVRGGEAHVRTTGTILFLERASNNVDAPFDLFRVDVDGSGLRRLTAGADVHEGYSWSSDGRSVAYTKCVPDARPSDRICDLYLLDLVSSTSKRLTKTPRVGESSPAWSPDGRSLAYTVFGSSQRLSTALVVTRADGGRVRRVPAEVSAVSWSPDSRSVAFVRRRNTPLFSVPQLFVLDVPSGRVVSLKVDGHDPRWSPDGRSIAFSYIEDPREYSGGRPAVIEVKTNAVSTLKTDRGDIVQWLGGAAVAVRTESGAVINERLDRPTRIRIFQGVDGATWDPRGSRVALVRCDRAVRCSLGVAPAAGGPVKTLRKGGYIPSPAWAGTTPVVPFR